MLLLCQIDGSVLLFVRRIHCSFIQYFVRFFLLYCVSVGYYTCTVARVHPEEMLRKMASSPSPGVGIWEHPTTTFRWWWSFKYWQIFVFWRCCTDTVVGPCSLLAECVVIFFSPNIFILLLYLSLMCVVSSSNTASGMPVARGEAEGMQCEQGTDADEWDVVVFPSQLETGRPPFLHAPPLPYPPALPLSVYQPIIRGQQPGAARPAAFAAAATSLSGGIVTTTMPPAEVSVALISHCTRKGGGAGCYLFLMVCCQNPTWLTGTRSNKALGR